MEYRQVESPVPVALVYRRYSEQNQTNRPPMEVGSTQQSANPKLEGLEEPSGAIDVFGATSDYPAQPCVAC